MAILIERIHCCSCHVQLDDVFYMAWNPDEQGFSDLARGISCVRMCKQCITSQVTTDLLALEVRADEATGAHFPHAIRTVLGADHVVLQSPDPSEVE